jgi:hypothetical protein
MAAFLFVTASVAVVMGLVGLVAGHMRGRRDANRSCALSLHLGPQGRTQVVEHEQA